MRNELQVRNNAEIARQMRERGSVSSLRGYREHNPVDLQLEICSEAVALATPTSPQGLEFLRKNVFRSEQISFGNALVITRSEFEQLTRIAHGVRLRIENYAAV